MEADKIFELILGNLGALALCIIALWWFTKRDKENQKTISELNKEIKEIAEKAIEAVTSQVIHTKTASEKLKYFEDIVSDQHDTTRSHITTTIAPLLKDGKHDSQTEA